MRNNTIILIIIGLMAVLVISFFAIRTTAFQTTLTPESIEKTCSYYGLGSVKDLPAMCWRYYNINSGVIIPIK